MRGTWRLGQIGVFHDETGDYNGTKEGDEMKLAPIWRSRWPLLEGVLVARLAGLCELDVKDWRVPAEPTATKGSLLGGDGY